MRTYAAALLISMAFISPAMAITAEPRPRPNPICELGRPTPNTKALPGNEFTRPGQVLSLRGLIIRIVLHLAGCDQKTR